MRKVERKLNKAQLTTVWLLIVATVLTAAYFTVYMIAKKRAENSDTTSPSAITDLKPGESLSSMNMPIAYEEISEKQIIFIDIENYKTNERFGVFREADENGEPNGSFMFQYYREDTQEFEAYYPPIISEDPNISYEDLYSIENDDGFGRIYYITYLCSALGTPLFSERIDIPTGEDEASKTKRETLYRDCGFTTDNKTEILLQYCNRDPETNEIIEGSEKTIMITVGGKALSGVGYYFLVNDGVNPRPYIYYTSSEYLSYALKNFGDFINGTLVSKGLSNDSVYGPYLTTNFTSWFGEKYTSGEISLTSDPTKYQNPLVIANGKYLYTKKTGYENGMGDLKFDLETLQEHQDFTRIKNAIVGKTVGKYQDPIILTLLEDLTPGASGDRLLSFAEAESLVYEYTITKIEAVITNNGERTDGTVGEGDNLIKVTYSLKVGEQTYEDCHAVIRRTELSASDAQLFNGKTVGENPDWDPIPLTVTYTKSNSLQTRHTYVLTDVHAVFDANGKLTDTITEDAYVNISYSIMINGKFSEEKTHPVRLSDLNEKHVLYALKDILLGKKAGEYNETIYDEVSRYEFMREFATYEISEIKYFTVNEIVVSFAFQNASERNPYYGETFYVNKLENEYKIYGLNTGSCESAVKLLGGIGSDGNSAAGLSGETVAVGLTAANMDKYNLYAHKIYFEMPRLIYDASEGAETDSADILSDFAWIDTIGFTLYISDATFDENGQRVRYIGSDMYDIVAKVYTDEFDFVEYSFVELWARKSVIMMDIKKLDEMKLEFYMDELTGSYSFDVKFENGYIGYVDGELVFTTENVEGFTVMNNYETVRVTASSDAFNTKFKDMFGADQSADLAWLYKQTVGKGTENYYPGSQDTYGAAYFNTAYSILQLVTYLDDLSDADQALAFAQKKIMSMSFKVDGQTLGGEEFYYTYDFYRLDDRRIMIALYKSNENGECIDDAGNVVPSDKIDEHTVSDFYIDTFTFKKLVNTYIQLLNGNDFDESIGYPGLR